MAKKKKKVAAPPKPPRHYGIYIIPVIIILGFLIYSNSFHTPFAFDDQSLLLDNQLLKHDTIFTQYNLPRYIGLVTFALNYKYQQLNTTGYHLVNLLIHIANAILVYLLVRTLLMLTKRRDDKTYLFYVPISTALIFLVHPIQTQAVTYIAQRFTALAALFTLSSVLLYVIFKTRQKGSWLYLILSMLCAVLAYKTKENTATLPFILIIIEYIFFKSSKTALAKKAFYLLPYFLLLGVIVISFVSMHGKFEDVLTGLAEKSKETKMISRSQYLITEFRVLVTYMRLLLLPVHQAIDYYYPLSDSFFESRTLLSFLLIAALAAGAIVSIPRFPITAFGILWFFNFVLIESSVIPISDVIFEHRVYLPSIGFILALTSLVFALLRDSTRHIAGIVLLCIIIALSAATYMRNKVWDSSISLWEDAAKKYPQNYRNHVNLGVSYAKLERFDEAIKELESGLPSSTTNAQGCIQLARCYYKKGNTQKGREWLNRAIQLDADAPSVIEGAATIYLEQRNYDAAITILNHGYPDNKSNLIINGLLARAYCSIGNLDKALFFFDEALRINSTYAEAHHDRGLCLVRNNKLLEARPSFLQSIALRPDLADAYYFVALSYDQEGDRTNAVRYYREAVDRSPAESPLSAKAQARLNELQ
jgi:protein O-mannosyl-transferase